MNYENFSPAVSAEFHNNCTASCTVLTCSCTVASYYWSSTSYAPGPSSAWHVYFDDGSVRAFGKSITYYVRAVRGGQ